MTIGVLYEIKQPSFLDRLDEFKRASQDGAPMPATEGVIRTLLPAL